MFKQELVGLLRFVRRPSFEIEPSTRPWISTIWLLVISLAATIGIALPIIIAASAIYEPVSIDDGTSGLWDEILLAVILAPLLEEPAFRLWASARRWKVAAGVATLLVWLTLAILVGADDNFSIYSIVGIASVGLTIVAVIVGHLLGRGHPRGFRRSHAAPIIWIAALGFGLFHITNFDPQTFETQYSPLIPFYVAPQIMAGFIYMYIRVRVRFWAAIGVHAAENLIFTLLAVAFPDAG